MKTYVCGFLFYEDQNRVVLIRKNKPDWQAGKLNGVGGAIEPGETPREAMIREWQEETSEARIDGWELFYEARFDDSKVYFFRNKAQSADIKVRSNTSETVVISEIDDLQLARWRSLRTVNQFQIEVEPLPNLRWLIPLAMSGDVLIGDQRANVYNKLLENSNSI